MLVLIKDTAQTDMVKDEDGKFQNVYITKPFLAAEVPVEKNQNYCTQLVGILAIHNWDP